MRLSLAVNNCALASGAETSFTEGFSEGMRRGCHKQGACKHLGCHWHDEKMGDLECYAHEPCDASSLQLHVTI